VRVYDLDTKLESTNHRDISVNLSFSADLTTPVASKILNLIKNASKSSSSNNNNKYKSGAFFPEYYDFSFELNRIRLRLESEAAAAAFSDNNNIISHRLEETVGGGGGGFRSSEIFGLMPADYDDESLPLNQSRNLFGGEDDYSVYMNESYSNQYLINQLKTPLFYILFMLLLYVVIILVVFMSAVYSHRKRDGYSYEDLCEKEDEEKKAKNRRTSSSRQELLKKPAESQCFLLDQTAMDQAGSLGVRQCEVERGLECAESLTSNDKDDDDDDDDDYEPEEQILNEKEAVSSESSSTSGSDNENELIYMNKTAKNSQFIDHQRGGDNSTISF
jgi:hypothetical protein